MKSKTTTLLKNLKMNEETYKLRRNVMACIYHAKRYANLPRIDVRITEGHKEILGLAGMSKNIIWIPETTKQRDLLQVILHEICHAVWGIEHNERCPLMASTLKDISENKAIEIFKKYASKGGK